MVKWDGEKERPHLRVTQWYRSQLYTSKSIEIRHRVSRLCLQGLSYTAHLECILSSKANAIGETRTAQERIKDHVHGVLIIWTVVDEKMSRNVLMMTPSVDLKQVWYTSLANPLESDMLMDKCTWAQITSSYNHWTFFSLHRSFQTHCELMFSVLLPLVETLLVWKLLYWIIHKGMRI